MKTVTMRRSLEGLVTYRFEADTVIRGVLLTTGGNLNETNLEYTCAVRMGTFLTVLAAGPVNGSPGVLVILQHFSTQLAATPEGGLTTMAIYVPLDYRVLQGESVTLVIQDVTGTMDGRAFAILYFD